MGLVIDLNHYSILTLIQTIPETLTKTRILEPESSIFLAYLICRILLCMRTRAVASGGASGALPPFEIGAPHLTFDPPVAAYIQYCILKMWPPFWFLAPLFGFWPPCY